ncbi:MAG: hypothetical protein Q4D99_08255, partial [Bacillota bacterium]|nr:hypothetical protein [Bacillota bacterium]
PVTDPAPAVEGTPETDSLPVGGDALAAAPAPESGDVQTGDSALDVGGATSSDSTPVGGAVQEIQYSGVPGTNNLAEEAKITPQELTVLLRGLTEKNKAQVMIEIDRIIQNAIGLPCYIDDMTLNLTDRFVDAEKFSTGTPGFDSQHCWAATAANVLWTTGYAQQATNPRTGNKFSNEDEVLAYFTDNFTDYPGDPEDGVDWFMKGTGAYSSELQNRNGLAHYTDVNSGGLLPEAQTTAAIVQLWNGRYNANTGEYKGTPNAISAVLSVLSQGMGVLVKWFENGVISNSAHWMTVVGTIIDDNQAEFQNKYKALIVADSDNNPAHTEAGVNFSETTFEQKLEAKADRVNGYTMYKLQFVPELNGNGAWRFVGFGETESRMAIVSHLYYLLDNDKKLEGDEGDPFNVLDLVDKSFLESSNGNCQTPVVEESNEAIVITDGQTAIVIAKEDILNALSETELETGENLSRLLEYMTDNNVEIFPQARGVVSVANGDNYVAYIKTPAAAKLTVSVDGIILPEDAYEIIVLPNGMTKIRVKNSYLKALSIGTHSLQINAEGVDSVINSVISVLE